MATEEIQISQLELAQEVQGDMVFAVDTATDTKSLSVNQLKNHISQPLQANINAVDTSALHKYNISNCITEIPQDIKLELSSGTLTLKAGSKVYVPNGFSGTTPKFDIITVASDMIGTSTSNGTYVLFVNSSGSAINWRNINSCFSGTSDPETNYTAYYNTSTNILKYYQASGTTYQVSLPLAIFTVSGGAISSIDQVFNGFGYIGSTIFALPGVKGLIPNGRNNDGSLKNIEFTTNNVVLHNYAYGAQDSYFGMVNDSTIGAFGKTISFYDNERNLVKDTYPSTPTYNSWQFSGSFSADSNNKISNFKVYPAFHAVDYNDFEKAMLKEDWVRVSTAPASPDSSKFYYIPEN